MGGLAGPARYTSARPKRENEREAPSQKNPRIFLASRFARPLVYRAGPANPPVLQAIAGTAARKQKPALSYDGPSSNLGIYLLVLALETKLGILPNDETLFWP